MSRVTLSNFSENLCFEIFTRQIIWINTIEDLALVHVLSMSFSTFWKKKIADYENLNGIIIKRPSFTFCIE